MLIRCKECGGWFDEEFFLSTGRSRASTCSTKYRRRVCEGCQQTAHDTAKSDLLGRAKVKARTTRASHAKRLGIPIAVLEQEYDWHIDKMAHGIVHAFDNGCPYCEKPFKEMPGQLHDMSIDVTDPSKPPFYKLCKWICKTCNRKKARTAPEKWAKKLINWERWREWQERIAKDPSLKDGPQLRLAFDLPKDDGNGKGEQLALL